MDNAEQIRAELQAAALELGLEAFGVAPVDIPLRRRYYEEWIGDGQHGQMQWMERNNDRRLNPASLIPEARSIVCLGINYYQDNPDRRGRVARYALGKDYHKVLLQKLKALCTIMREKYGGQQRPYVDTGPILEKPIAALAGLGWQGKSTILINRKSGTWLFLGLIVTTLELPANPTPPKDNCGKCTRCLDACPTGAITAPYQLDARRCIAYLTIEHQGAIPEHYRRPIGDRLYGCDECLDVCPWNHWAHQTREAKFAARPLPDLTTMLGWSQETFDEVMAGTPIRRIGLARWQRNACVVLGNIGTEADIPALEAAAAADIPPEDIPLEDITEADSPATDLPPAESPPEMPSAASADTPPADAQADDTPAQAGTAPQPRAAIPAGLVREHALWAIAEIRARAAR